MAETDWESMKQRFKEYDQLVEQGRKRREQLLGPWPPPRPIERFWWIDENIDPQWHPPFWSAPQTGQQIYKCNWRTNLHTGHSWIESMVQRDGTVIELRDGTVVELPVWPRPSPEQQYNWCPYCNSWHPTWWMTEMLRGDWRPLPEVPDYGPGLY